MFPIYDKTPENIFITKYYYHIITKLYAIGCALLSPLRWGLGFSITNLDNDIGAQTVAVVDAHTPKTR